MAIDTAEKRKSVAGVGVPALFLGVTPNASQDAEWRQQAGWGYSGITPAAVASSVEIVLLRVTASSYSLRVTNALMSLRTTIDRWMLRRT